MVKACFNYVYALKIEIKCKISGKTLISTYLEGDYLGSVAIIKHLVTSMQNGSI